CMSDAPRLAAVARIPSISSGPGAGVRNSARVIPMSGSDTEHLLDRGQAVSGLGPSVIAQAGHALRGGDLSDLRARRVPQDKGFDLVCHPHHLVQTHATLVAGPGAGRADRKSVV